MFVETEELATVLMILRTSIGVNQHTHQYNNNNNNITVTVKEV